MTQINLPYLAAARVSSEDAGTFLQAQLTADLTRLSDGEACFSGYCDPKGNVLALMRVQRHGEDYILIAAKSLIEPLLAELGKYVLRADVTLKLLDSNVVGAMEEEAVKYGLKPQDSRDAGEAVESLEEWRAGELGSGIVWLSPETSGRFLPQMLGLEKLDAVSFRKGCFPGQEVVARVRYLGKLKRKPLIVETEGTLDAPPGSDATLFSGDNEAGSAVVVDSAPSGEGTVIFLVARVPDDAAPDALEIDGARRSLRESIQT